MKKYIITILFAFFALTKVVFASDFNINGKNIVLYNLNEDEVVYSKDMDVKTPVASLTKIMTTIVGIENISDLNKEVIVKSNDLYGLNGYSKAGLKIGDRLTFKDLLYGIMLPSGGDAVNVLVNNSLGYEGFVYKMNETAKKIGLYNTYFSNPIGKDDNANCSTANDIAKLLKYALKNEIFSEVFKTKMYSIQDKITFKSTLSYYDGLLDTGKILGAKSGYTVDAGRCLASIANLNDVNYLLIVINSGNDSPDSAIKDTLTIYDYYSKNYGYKNVLRKNDIIKKIPVKYSGQKYYDIKPSKDVRMYLKNDSNIKYEYKGKDIINYKLKKSAYIGSIKVYNDDRLIYIDNIYLNQNIIYYNIILWISLLIFILLTIIVSIIIATNKKKNNLGEKTEILTL